MDYIELDIPVSDDEKADIVTALLADFPFESFESDGGMLKAYIPQERLAECKEQVDAALDALKITQRRYISIETRNWNSLWESNFSPVDVDGRIYIRAPFHEPYTGNGMEVVIMPKMSFGTGHHPTTCLMAAAALDTSLHGRKGLDMGSGTGVLSIIAAKCGAAEVDAVDIDEWACENCHENAEANGVGDIVRAIHGDIRAIAGLSYDFILANINRNILLADMPAYAAALVTGGTLAMSGFLEQDVPHITSAAEKLGFSIEDIPSRDGWMAVICRKTE